MKKLGLCLLLLLVSLPAEAKVLELYGQIQGGGGSGRGVYGAQMNNDFFEGSQGAAYGARVGVEVLWIDAWIDHTQFTDLDRVPSGTWTRFMAGFDWDFSLDTPPPGKKSKSFGEIGLGLGFGVGTGQQVDPPLSNAQITDKGFLGELKLGFEYRMNAAMAIGVTVPVTYGYLFKNGIANDESNHYMSLSVTGLAFFRVTIPVK